jgi:hypothetical protein
MISVCGASATTTLGRRALQLYPNNIGLSGAARADKLASLASADHYAGTRAEMLASTDRRLAGAYLDLPRLPMGFIVSTVVARGTRDFARSVGAATEVLDIPNAGHAGILKARHAGAIAGLGERLWQAGHDAAALNNCRAGA